MEWVSRAIDWANQNEGLLQALAMLGGIAALLISLKHQRDEAAARAQAEQVVPSQLIVRPRPEDVDTLTAIASGFGGVETRADDDIVAVFADADEAARAALRIQSRFGGTGREILLLERSAPIPLTRDDCQGAVRATAGIRRALRDAKDLRVREQGPAAFPFVVRAATPVDALRPWLLPTMGLALLIAGLVWLGSAHPRRFEGFSGPAIAVLPFHNLSGDPEQDLLARGLVEDLTTRLARWRHFPVIGRNSIVEFATQEPERHAGAVREQLGADYFVEGSIRRAADVVRITAKLVEVRSRSHVWAETYDRPYGALLAIQDEISQAIAATLISNLGELEGRRASLQNPEDLDAWSNTQRGWWHFYRETPEDNALAREFFERAIEQDPSWGQPHAGVSLTHYKDRAHLWSDAPGQSLDRLVAFARRAVEIDGNDASAHHALGHAYAMSGLTGRMIGAFARSVEINPSDPMANNCLGAHLGHVGETDRAIGHLRRALDLSPQDPRAPLFLTNLASAYFSAGEYEGALKWAEKSIARQPGTNAYQILVASLAYLNRLEDAETALVELTRLYPNLSPAAIRQYYAAARPEHATRVIEGLKLAGWIPPKDSGGVYPQM